MIKLARRALGVSPSPTLSIDAKFKQMKADGIDVMGFGVGEPDFDTPASIRKAAIDAIQGGFTKYTPSSGIPELKAAVCARVFKDTGLQYEASQVVISSGAKHCLYNILQVLCDEGDEIIILSPYWVSYPEMVKLAGGVPVFVEATADSQFRPDPRDIEAAITPKTRGIILNSPSNPTGTILPKADLESIAEIAARHDLYIISDEIYNRLVYDGSAASIASVSADAKARTLMVNGVSKTYSMTGWRVGYTLGDKAVMAAIGDLQSHSTSNPNSIAQKAAYAALSDESLESEVCMMVEEFGRRRNILVEALNDIPGIQCPCPQGAFYVFPRIAEFFGRSYRGAVINNSVDFAEMLLSEAKVAVVSGSGFGADDHVRLSYATSMKSIRIGVARIAEFIAALE